MVFLVTPVYIFTVCIIVPMSACSALTPPALDRVIEVDVAARRMHIQVRTDNAEANQEAKKT